MNQNNNQQIDQTRGLFIIDSNNSQLIVDNIQDLIRDTQEITIIILFYLIIYTINKLKKVVEKILLPNSFNYSKELSQWAERLLVLSNADRVTIGIFTNGEVYANNISVKYMLIPIERVAPGISTIYHKKTIIPINTIIDEITTCCGSTDSISIKDARDSNLNDNCRSYLLRNGIMILVTIYIPEKGFIGIHYSNKNEIDESKVRKIISSSLINDCISVIKGYVKDPKSMTIKSFMSKYLTK